MWVHTILDNTVHNSDLDTWHVSDGWRVQPHHLPNDRLWQTIVSEAQRDAVG